MTDIMIVGEAFGRHEAEKGRPFVGPSGGLLNSFLSANGINRSECYLTNVFNFQPMGNKIETLCGPKSERIPGLPSIKSGKYIRSEYKHELDRLYTEVRTNNPNIIVALGGTATWALLHDVRIKKLRGAPVVGVTGHKVLPTYHPAAVLRDFKLRPIVFSDFKKVAREAAFPDVRRPQREFVFHPTLADLERIEREHILPATKLSVDIETWARQITCIGFAPSKDFAIVIPFVWKETKDGNYWPTLEEELQAWAYVRRWLNLGKPVFGQNFLYDARYLWSIYGIPINYIAGDTMLNHHAQQPEMEKSLGFLGSIHTDEPSWKFMRSNIETLKKED